MRSIAFAQIRRHLRTLLSDGAVVCGKQHPKACTGWKVALDEQLARLDQEAQLRVALIGEFSAGKSSLISALTGDEIRIGADVTTTDISEYPWQGVVLVDTPGVQSQATAVDHDRIAREATVRADLILFVVTNELFNDRLAQHLRYVIGDKGLRLAHKTAMVVNKMDRETNPDEVICSEVCKVLGEHRDLPVWFCAAERFLQARTLQGTMQDRFRRESRMDELIDHIDNFVQDRGLIGRLTTPLQVLEDTLDGAEAALAEGDAVRNEVELLRRQKRILTQLRTSLMALKQVWKQRIQTAVMKRADIALRELKDDMDAEKLEKLIEQGLADASVEIGALHDGAAADVGSAIEAARNEMEELGNSALGQAVLEVASRSPGTQGVTLDSAPAKSGTTAAKLARDMVPAFQNTLKQAAKDAKGMRDLVYNMGKSMGKKFRPWEATKAGGGLAKGAGRLAKALPFVAVAVDAWINYREEQAKEEQQKHLATLRLAVRRAFSEHAVAEGEAAATAIGKCSNEAVAPAVAQIDERTAAIANSRQTHAEVAAKLADLKGRCASLRTKIEHRAARA